MHIIHKQNIQTLQTQLSGSLTFKCEEYSVLTPFTNGDLSLIKYANKTSLAIVLRIKLQT